VGKKKQMKKLLREISRNSSDYAMESNRKQCVKSLDRVERVLEVASGMALMKKIFG